MLLKIERKKNDLKSLKISTFVSISIVKIIVLPWIVLMICHFLINLDVVKLSEKNLKRKIELHMRPNRLKKQNYMHKIK